METNQPIEAPTWYGQIRNMFTQTDIDHMKAQGLDLTNYESVKNSAGGIYGQVASGHMPPGNPWSQDWVDTFLAWMSADYPKGTPPPEQNKFLGLRSAFVNARVATRMRKEISSLSDAEVTLLKQAFVGIMNKEPDDPNGYFKQAGYHWLPEGNLFCQHHVPGYNPWHRAELYSFENALRSIPGCENVTLPYWDITTPFPDIFSQPPFDRYTLPLDIGNGFNAGYVTQRFDAATINANVVAADVAGLINNALSKTDWDDFHGLIAGALNDTIIAAHDQGHGCIGPTVADQDVAAFDPVFWFFHANWDRLFWQWQKKMGATDLNGLLSTINKESDRLSYNLFTIPALLPLKPFSFQNPQLTTVGIIDSVNNLDVDYEEPEALADVTMVPKMERISAATRKFSVKTDRVNVRVQGVNRLKIPGSFRVHLLKNGDVIRSRFFFQPNEVEKCENCVQNAVVHFDFELPLETVSGGELAVWVEPVNKNFVGDRFPSKMMGDPTVEARFLLSNE